LPDMLLAPARSHLYRRARIRIHTPAPALALARPYPCSHPHARRARTHTPVPVPALASTCLCPRSHPHARARACTHTPACSRLYPTSTYTPMLPALASASNHTIKNYRRKKRERKRRTHNVWHAENAPHRDCAAMTRISSRVEGGQQASRAKVTATVRAPGFPGHACGKRFPSRARAPSLRSRGADGPIPEA
jgi:hypothetical protein